MYIFWWSSHHRVVVNSLLVWVRFPPQVIWFYSVAFWCKTVVNKRAVILSRKTSLPSDSELMLDCRFLIPVRESIFTHTVGIFREATYTVLEYIAKQENGLSFWPKWYDMCGKLNVCTSNKSVWKQWKWKSTSDTYEILRYDKAYTYICMYRTIIYCVKVLNSIYLVLSMVSL